MPTNEPRSDDTDGGGPPANKIITERISADRDWLEQHGVRLTQWGPDAASGKVKIYLTDYSDAARQVLVDRYGEAIVVHPESRPRPHRLGPDKVVPGRGDADTGHTGIRTYGEDQ